MSSKEHSRRRSISKDSASQDGKKTGYHGHQNFLKVKWPSGSEDVHYSLFCDSLPGDIIKNAQKEVKETEENKAEGIKRLREFMERKKFRCPDDEVLIAALRNCKYDIKKSEVKLEKFLKVRHMVSSKLADYDIIHIETVLGELAGGALPYRDTQGRILLYSRAVEKVATYETELLAVTYLALILFFLSTPMTSLLGIIYFPEGGYSSLAFCYSLLKVLKSLVRNAICVPLRIVKVQFIYGTFLTRWVYNILRPLLPRKISNRVSFFSEGYKSLCEGYHPDIIPKEFGGNLGPLNDVYYRKEFLDFVEKLKAENIKS